MIDPKRWLIDADAPEEARRLLRALEVPAPPGPAKQAELTRRLASLASGPGAPPASPLGGSWLKLGLVSGAAVSGAILVLAAFQALWGGQSGTQGATPKLDTVEPVNVVAAPLARGEVDAAGPPPISPSPAAVEPRAAEPRAVEPRATEPRPRSTPARSVQRVAADALAAEEALLERARGFASTAPERAWDLLEKHRRRFPAGQLVAERMSLSVDVLRRLGQARAAQVQAEALIRQFPGSVYAEQLRHGSSAPQ